MPRARHTAGKQARLETRLTLSQKRMIERAASLRGSTVSEFILASVQAAAEQVIERSQVLRLRGEAAEAFARAILAPPAPNQKLRAAAREYLQKRER